MSKIILFDGECNFCDSFVNFVVKRDSKNEFRLCALQSQCAKNLSAKYNFEIEQQNLSSVILLNDEKIYKKSTAAIKILSQLGGLWHLMPALFIIPKFLRDFFYDYFAKNRYRWFGKKEICEINSAEINQRLLK